MVAAATTSSPWVSPQRENARLDVTITDPVRNATRSARRTTRPTWRRRAGRADPACWSWKTLGTPLRARRLPLVACSSARLPSHRRAAQGWDSARCDAVSQPYSGPQRDRSRPYIGLEAAPIQPRSSLDAASHRPHIGFVEQKSLQHDMKSTTGPQPGSLVTASGPDAARHRPHIGLGHKPRAARGPDPAGLPR